MKLSRVFSILITLFFTLQVEAASLCSQVHLPAQSPFITDSGKLLSSEQNDLILSNMTKYSRWLSETQILESGRIDVNAKMFGAQINFANRLISISPKLLGNKGTGDIKNFTVVLLHEYSHGHLENFLSSKIPTFKDSRSQFNTLPFSKKNDQMISGIHELIADILPALALKEPNVMSDLVLELELPSAIFGFETATKIRTSRKFKDNPYSSVHRWSEDMKSIEFLDGNWDPYMMFSFARDRIWQKTQQISVQQGNLSAQNYVKSFAQRMVQEIMFGRLKNGMTLNLAALRTTTEQILEETNQAFP